MPRGPRIDVPEALYHVIARGVERRAIFRADRDREDFVGRVARLVGEEDITLFAYVLLDNHFHLVVRRGRRPLGQFMRRLLTGYSAAFNRRHRRAGHLFQNRYQAVLCDADEYLLTLVRYVHRNPVRAGRVAEPAAYRWSSAGAYRRGGAPAWLETATVLEMVGGRAGYRRFMQEGAQEGKRPELSGRMTAAMEQEQSRPWLGGQVLGQERFAQRAVRQARQREAEQLMEAGRAEELPGLAAKVAKRLRLPVERLRGAGRAAAVSAARRELIRAAVLERGIRPVAVSRYLGISTAAVAQHLRACEGAA